MISDQVRLHLSARRPSGQDDADPAIAEALAQAAADPQLAAWAEAEKSADAVLAAKLKQVQPPPGLRDTILAGASVGRRKWWDWFNSKAWRNFRNSEVFAIAALLIIFASAIAYNSFVKTAPSWQFAATEQIARIEASEVPLALMTSKVPAVHQWLLEQTCPAPRSLRAMPDAIKELALLGCTKMQWRGNTMSIMCFSLGENEEVHLVMISRSNLPDAPPLNSPVYASINGYSTASWSEEDIAMMLITKARQEKLKQLLGEATAMLPEGRKFVEF